ncbi:MmcQ/YjbR family DNA-binding protein [Bizionia sediminis]|uniref:MmcQ/YjbR family DNA-binding protein n=1 Tax=Bizionia sediminis TaxID=1737064 RepID=A0ABW5KR90_9FLAO
MNIETLRNFCLDKKAVTEHLPFNEDVLVFKVAGKIFLLTSLKSWELNRATINLKCQPEYALELRSNYHSVLPGYHANKKHWNTINLFTGELNASLVKQLITHSYQQVVAGLTNKQRTLFHLN